MQILISLQDVPEKQADSEFSANVTINMQFIRRPDEPDDTPAKLLADFLQKSIELYVAQYGNVLEKTASRESACLH